MKENVMLAAQIFDILYWGKLFFIIIRTPYSKRLELSDIPDIFARRCIIFQFLVLYATTNNIMPLGTQLGFFYFHNKFMGL
jgi:hypothetical protein